MNSQQFVKASRKQVQRVVHYLLDQAPGMVIQKTYRFIDGNFRAQGWQGQKFEKWAPISRKVRGKPGTILVKSGALRRSFNHSSAGPGEVRFYSNVKYSGIHNRGGIINMPARERMIKLRTDGKGNFIRQSNLTIGPGSKSSYQLAVFAKKSHKNFTQAKVQVGAYQIKMTKRQFAPYEGSESPVLNNSIIREITREINKILIPQA